MFAFLGFGLVAAHTRLIKPVLIGFLHAHMGIVTVDAREIDVRIVFVEIALIRTLKTSAHLKSFCMSSHHKSRIALVGRHVNGEHGIEVHAWSEVGEFFSRF